MVTIARDKDKPIQYAKEHADTWIEESNLTNMLPIVVGAIGVLAASISIFCGDSCDADGTVRQRNDAAMSEEYVD